MNMMWCISRALAKFSILYNFVLSVCDTHTAYCTELKTYCGCACIRVNLQCAQWCKISEHENHEENSRCKFMHSLSLYLFIYYSLPNVWKKLEKKSYHEYVKFRYIFELHLKTFKFFRKNYINNPPVDASNWHLKANCIDIIKLRKMCNSYI